MAKSAAERYAKWFARFTKDGDGKVPESCSATMLRVTENGVTAPIVQANFVAQVETEEAVRAILNAEGVSMIQYPFYLNFGREMSKLVSRVSGESAKIAAAILVAKYTAYGLNQVELEQIREDVFGITDPTP